MNKLSLGDLNVESFITAPDVEELELDVFTRTRAGTCCGVECTGGTTTRNEE